MYFKEKNLSINEKIGNNIRIFREVNGISRKTLAEKFCISDDAVYRIERGESGFAGEYAYILANEFGCDMNYIYCSIDDEEVFRRNVKRVLYNTDKENIRESIPGMLRHVAKLLEETL